MTQLPFLNLRLQNHTTPTDVLALESVAFVESYMRWSRQGETGEKEFFWGDWYVNDAEKLDEQKNEFIDLFNQLQINNNKNEVLNKIIEKHNELIEEVEGAGRDPHVLLWKLVKKKIDDAISKHEMQASFKWTSGNNAISPEGGHVPMSHHDPQPRAGPGPSAVCLALDVLGNRDLQQSIVRCQDGEEGFNMRPLSKGIKETFDELDMTYLNPCGGGQECGTNIKIVLHVTSYKEFVASFKKACEKPPDMLHLDGTRGSPSIPWERVLGAQDAKKAFSCVTYVSSCGGGGIAFLLFAISIGSLASLQQLYLGRNNISDDEMVALAGAIASGSLPKLEVLYLDRNRIGDAGMTELSRAITSGSLGSLTFLGLGYNQVGDAGMIELSRAIASGSLLKLEYLWLYNNQIGEDGMAALKDVITDGFLPAISYLSLLNNPGDASIAMDALKTHRSA